MAPPYRPVLDLHDANDDVKELQNLLNQWGYFLEVDGKFESKTQEAVQEFQRKKGIPAEGIVGPLTWAALLGINLGDLNTSVSPTRQVVEEKDVKQQIKKIRQQLENKQDVPLVKVAQAKLLSRDDYISKLLKYIPTEVIGVYLTLDALVRSSDNIDLYWTIFLFGLIVTPLYLWRVQEVYKKKQLLLATGAFIVWVFGTSRLLEKYDWYDPLVAAVVLIIYTFLLPLL